MNAPAPAQGGALGGYLAALGCAALAGVWYAGLLPLRAYGALGWGRSGPHRLVT